MMSLRVGYEASLMVLKYVVVRLSCCEVLWALKLAEQSS